jgi:siroheme synthase
VATLATLAEAARASDLGSPALVVIGRVVGLARLIGQVEQLHRVA